MALIDRSQIKIAEKLKDIDLKDEISPSENKVEKEFLEHGPLENDEISPLSHSVNICEETVNPPGEKVTAHDFDLLKKLGKGGYGQVFLTKKVNGVKSGEYYAMKVVKKARLITNKKDDTRYAMTERNVLEACDHPFLVHLYFAFQTSHNLFMVLEYLAGGELFMHLERQSVLSEDEARFYLSEITLALGHLHSVGIIYRDLKSENVMLDKDGHVKLTDFGLSKERSKDELAHSFCGTVEYMAPEILQRKGHSFSVDWWSMGCLFYDMVIGSSPFAANGNRGAVIQKITSVKYKIPRFMTESGKHLLKNLLLKKPELRLGGGEKGVEDIKKHFFFRNIDWNKCFKRKLKPPFVPTLSGREDVSCFDKDIVAEPCVISPTQNTGLSVSNRNGLATGAAGGGGYHWFENFSFVSPQIYLDNGCHGNGVSRQRSRSGVSHSSSSPGDIRNDQTTQFLFEEDFEDIR